MKHNETNSNRFELTIVLKRILFVHLKSQASLLLVLILMLITLEFNSTGIWYEYLSQFIK